jgi:putative NADH-flavin reductase
MKLFVLGASGGVGAQLVELAIARGHSLTILARPEAVLAPSVAAAAPRVTVVRGHVDDAASFAKLGGHDAVASCVGNRRAGRSPFAALRSATDVCETTAKAIVKAMQQHGVTRVVAISAGGVGDSGGDLNWVMSFLLKHSSIGVAYADLEKMEQAFASSSPALDWLCVRPVTLTNAKPSAKPVRVVPRFGALDTIARADVARFMLDELEKPGPFTNRTPQIAT